MPREFDPNQARDELNALLASPFPCDELKTSIAQIPQRLPSSLQTELRQNDDFTSLLWLHLPQVANLWKKHNHISGLEPEELFNFCLQAVSEQIQEWRPESDYLTSIIDREGKRMVEAAISQWYGLKPRQYPVIDFYYQARARYELEQGRQAGWDDLPQLKEHIQELLETAATAEEKGIVTAALNPVIPKNNKDAWRGDILNMIHQHHCNQVARQTKESLETEPDYDASFLPDSVETTLRSLSQEERKLLVLHFWNNLTEREIAKQLGMSESKVSNALQKTLRKLRHPINARFLKDWLL